MVATKGFCTLGTRTERPSLLGSTMGAEAEK
jgi:hypothetical protein